MEQIDFGNKLNYVNQTVCVNQGQKNKGCKGLKKLHLFKENMNYLWLIYKLQVLVTFNLFLFEQMNFVNV